MSSSILNREKKKTANFKVISSKDTKLFYFELSLITPFILLLLKFFKSTNFKAIFSNFIVELFFYMFFYFIFIELTFKFKSKNKVLKFIRYFFVFLFWIIFIVNTLLFVGNSLFFNDLLKVKYSLFSVKYNLLLYVIKNILSINYYIISILIFITTFILLFLFKQGYIKKDFILKPYSYRYHLFLVILFLFVFIITFEENVVVNQYVYSFVLASGVNSDRIKINNFSKPLTDNYSNIPIHIHKQSKDVHDFINQFNFSLFNKSLINYSSYNLTKNQKILLFIMEQTTFDEFMKAYKTIPKNKNFFMMIENHSLLFTNYYTLNQDSRTAIWTMLNSIFIPYECYYHDWNKKYGIAIENKNLVDLFKYHNYTTVVASSVYVPNLIMAVYPWDDLIYLKDFNPNNKEYICLQEFKFQKGCEDKIILPDIENFLLKHKNESVFLVQELIFGHGEDYRKSYGKHQIFYYNDYFLHLFNFLKDNDLLENTTIIIVSDHGEKGYFKKKSKDFFKIPLIIYNKRIQGQKINTFLTHLEFKDILLSLLLNNFSTEQFMNNKSFDYTPSCKYIIGSTGTNYLLFLCPNGNYFSGILNRNTFIVDIKGNFNDIEIKNVLFLFKKYQTYIKNLSLERNISCKYCHRNLQMVKYEQKIYLKNKSKK